jgi:non-lysosomal glucosylceramidase
VALFNWTATNPSDAPVTVGLMFTWQNLLGYGFGQDEAGGQQHSVFEEQTDAGLMRGVVMRHTGAELTDEWGGTMAIAALEVPGVSVSYRTRFQTNGDGADIWNDFAAEASGQVNDESVANREVLGAGIAVRFAPSRDRRSVPFAGVRYAGDDVRQHQSSVAGTSWYKRYRSMTRRHAPGSP